jgi:hypothetical protein
MRATESARSENARNLSRLFNESEYRIEHFRQAGENSRQRQSSVKDYGLQTLKWAFIINAGGAALILAYIGARYGKPEFSNQPGGPLLKAVWPFGAGCFLIIIAGAAGYFNFSYSTWLLPSDEELHNFLNVRTKTPKWPRPIAMRIEESVSDFNKRIYKRLELTQKTAVISCFGSAFCFIYGVWRVLRILT